MIISWWTSEMAHPVRLETAFQVEHHKKFYEVAVFGPLLWLCGSVSTILAPTCVSIWFPDVSFKSIIYIPCRMIVSRGLANLSPWYGKFTSITHPGGSSISALIVATPFWGWQFERSPCCRVAQLHRLSLTAMIFPSWPSLRRASTSKLNSTVFRSWRNVPLASTAQGRPLEIALVSCQGEERLDYIWHGVGVMEIDEMVNRLFAGSSM